ncbi:MAG: hypothetical protein HFJ02_00635 [Bacilli bacterium]|nr:hypothetical protein [Bacilli bacterium]
MNHLYISKEKLNNYPLFSKEYSVEAKIRILNDQELLKIFHEVTKEKLETLERILKYNKILNQINEFLFFKDYIIDEKTHEILGIIIDKSYEKNLFEYAKKAKFNDLIKVLKKIGQTLEHLKELKKAEPNLKGFAIGDLQERNILIEEETHQIKIIDLDSCTFSTPTVYHSKNLVGLKNTLFPSNLSFKYQLNNYKLINCNFNTDIYCYLMIILKLLFNYDITTSKINIQSYSYHIENLLNQGLPKPIYDSLMALFKPINNLNPYQYLEDIPYKFERKKGHNPF